MIRPSQIFYLLLVAIKGSIFLLCSRVTKRRDRIWNRQSSAEIEQAHAALTQMDKNINELLGVTEGGFEAANDRYFQLLTDSFHTSNELHMAREKREALVAE